MYFALGIFDQSILDRNPPSTRVGTYSAVGAAMSYRPVAPAWSFVIRSELDPKMS